MNPISLKEVVGVAPVCLLFAGSLVSLSKVRSTWCLLQVVGAGALVVVILAHLCEGLHWLPWMGWGLEHSAGHYLDLWSAVLAVTLFALGYFLDALGRHDERR
jgi:hypothetical protein